MRLVDFHSHYVGPSFALITLARVAAVAARLVAGVPIGTLLLTEINPVHLRAGIGLLLVLSADIAIGIMNGLLGGLTGLTGIIVAIWCQLRGWPKDLQRAVFQPVNLANIVIAAASLSIADIVTWETVTLYFLGLPLLLAGLWSGFKLYGKLDDAAFREVLLLVVLICGLALIPFTAALA